MHPMAKQIERWPIGRLIPYARNPRTHSDGQIAQIAASIAEFGFTNPILVDTNAGIIAGHGRLLAACKLNLDQVPVIILDYLSETQKRAYIIADNRLALNAGWDEETRRIELAALDEDEFNVSLLGFEDEELARLLAADATEGLTDEDAVSELSPSPFSVPGDLWLLGEHRLLRGDAMSLASFRA
jgi:ParB-like chromosome segregation protein Spo0J